MSQPTTEGPTALNTSHEGNRLSSDDSTLRIDDEPFEVLSFANRRGPREERPRIVRWFESWSGENR